MSNDSSTTRSPDAGRPIAAPQTDQPLGLTVHSLPTPQPLGADQGTRTQRGRWQMLVVMLLCAAPVVASYITYYMVRPDARRNFGELIEPQRDLPDLASVDLAGHQSNLKALRGQWLLVSVAGAACDETCRAHLYLQRQLLTSLGKNKDRVDWVWLIPDEAAVPDRLLPALKDATALRVPAAGLAAWLTPENGHQLADHLYVVDPMGHWMMRFPASLALSSADKAKRDLERLLLASASWNVGGRPGQPARDPSGKP